MKRLWREFAPAYCTIISILIKKGFWITVNGRGHGRVVAAKLSRRAVV